MLSFIRFEYFLNAFRIEIFDAWVKLKTNLRRVTEPDLVFATAPVRAHLNSTTTTKTSQKFENCDVVDHIERGSFEEKQKFVTFPSHTSSRASRSSQSPPPDAV